MKTRIKVVEYLNGRLAFFPQYQQCFMWWNLHDQPQYASRSESRQAAQQRIDKWIADKEFWRLHDTKKSVKYDYENTGE